MIDIIKQEELFTAIGNALPKKVSVYAIGGTAMMFHGIKDSTKDIDLVFESQKERAAFMETLRKLGSKGSDVNFVYGLKENTPLMLEFDNCRFDMFLSKIITSTFSDKMKERARQVHEFGNLLIKAADPSDVIIMKSATSRDKDGDDIGLIVNKQRIDWSQVIEEAKEQVVLGNNKAVLELGIKLSGLFKSKTANIPESVLDELWNMFEKQSKGKTKRE